jgi:hypothetical protein
VVIEDITVIWNTDLCIGVAVLMLVDQHQSWLKLSMYMAVVTQLYFKIVEEFNYMFRSFWVCHHQVETIISGKTHTLQCGYQEWGNEKLFKDNEIKVLLILIF